MGHSLVADFDDHGFSGKRFRIYTARDGGYRLKVTDSNGSPPAEVTIPYHDYATSTDTDRRLVVRVLVRLLHHQIENGQHFETADYCAIYQKILGGMRAEARAARVNP